MKLELYGVVFTNLAIYWDTTSMAINRRCNGPAAVNGNPLQRRAGRQRTWHGAASARENVGMWSILSL